MRSLVTRVSGQLRDDSQVSLTYSPESSVGEVSVWLPPQGVLNYSRALEGFNENVPEAEKVDG